MALPNLIACVRGNHEGYLLPETPLDGMDEAERASHEWERSAVSDEARAFLAGCPSRRQSRFAGCASSAPTTPARRTGRFCPFPRKSCGNTARGSMRISVLYGHDHTPFWEEGAPILASPGSLGCPGREKTAARAGILTVKDGECCWEPLRLPYDPSPCLEKLRELSLPDGKIVAKIFYGAEL